MVFSDLGFIAFALFCLALLIQGWYYIKIFSRLSFYAEKKNSLVYLPPASVIICARNEDDNLIEFLPSILHQDYPVYEVVVVNDCSTDNTTDILDEFARKYNNLKIVTIKEDENYTHGKKLALMIGIKGAQYEHLLLTDADCKPHGKEWVKHMMSNFAGNTEIVLGYGSYQKNKGFLNKLIRFDTFYIALQYLSCCLVGKTYMGVGRNLAYKKSLFFNHKGFASHYHITSGDDDLFINEAASKSNSKIEIHPESITISKSKKTYKAWFHQKRRHISTAKYYKGTSKLNLGALIGSQYLFFILFVLLLTLHFHPYLILTLFSLRFITQLVIFKKSMERLGERDLLLFSPLLEIGLMIFYPLTASSNLFLKKNKWKR